LPETLPHNDRMDTPVEASAADAEIIVSLRQVGEVELDLQNRIAVDDAGLTRCSLQAAAVRGKQFDLVLSVVTAKRKRDCEIQLFARQLP
jgi:hypothetical protein